MLREINAHCHNIEMNVQMDQAYPCPLQRLVLSMRLGLGFVLNTQIAQTLQGTAKGSSRVLLPGDGLLRLPTFRISLYPLRVQARTLQAL